MSLARRFCCLACVILLALADSANAGEVEDRRFLRDLLSTDTIPIESFTQSFLEAVPETKLRVALRPFRQNYGKVRRVSLDGERYVVWTKVTRFPLRSGATLQERSTRSSFTPRHGSLQISKLIWRQSKSCPARSLTSSQRTAKSWQPAGKTRPWQSGRLSNWQFWRR